MLIPLISLGLVVIRLLMYKNFC